MKFNGWIFGLLVLLSLGFAYFLSAWGPSPIVLMYVPNIPEDGRAWVSELILLAILYSPLIYLIIFAARRR